MFGMLDYRSHKLYKLIFLFPSIFLYFVGLILLPVASLLIAAEYADSIYSFLLYAIGAIFVGEIIFQIIGVHVIGRFFNAIFYYLVDVIPANGRNKEQANYVAKFGRIGELDLKFAQHPSTWLDCEIEELGEIDWVQRLFFNGKTKKRMYAVREHYLNSADEFYGAVSIDRFLRKNGLGADFWERVFVNKIYRIIMLRYFIFLAGIFYVLNSGNF